MSRAAPSAQRRDPQPRHHDRKGPHQLGLGRQGLYQRRARRGVQRPGQVWGVMRKAPKGAPLHPRDERINRLIATVRAKVEYPFRIIKRQFGHVKTRYRGLAKNRAQLFTLFALANLFLVRRS
ncbi:transposase [Cereibacter johrii]|nr:transposase [Cereibacter johrii]